MKCWSHGEDTVVEGAYT